MVHVYYDPEDTYERRFGVFGIKKGYIVTCKKLNNSSWAHTPILRSPFIAANNTVNIEDMSAFILLLTFPTEKAYDEWAAQDHPELEI